jgi:hypothetical protein
MTARIRWLAIAFAAVTVVAIVLSWLSTRDGRPPTLAKKEDASHSAVAQQPPTPPLRLRPILRRPPSLPPVHTGPAPIEIEADPHATNYDASKLFAVTGGSPAEFFKREPRNDAWATDRERIVNDLTLSALQEIDPNVKVATECHTGVCKVSIHSKKFFNVAMFGPYPFNCIAEHMSPVHGPDVSPDGIEPDATDPYSDVYLLFGQKTHDIGSTEVRERCEWAHEWFEERLEKYRAMTELPW